MQKDVDELTIGVLDIYGFEIFEVGQDRNPSFLAI